MLRAVTLPLYWLGYVVQCLWWLLFSGAPRAWKWIRGQKKAPTHGNAGFASLDELKADGHLRPGGVLYGIQDGRRVFARSESCALFFAKRGEGKSMTLGANLRYAPTLPKPPSILINDPKQEQHNTHAREMEAKGYDIMLLDLDHPEQSTFRGQPTQYNPMTFFKHSTTISYGRDVDSTAGLMIPEGEEGVNSHHFISGALGVLVGVLDWTFSQNPNCELWDAVKVLTVESEARRDKLLEKISMVGSDKAKAGVNVFLRVKEREKGSFTSTMGRKLRVFNDDAIKAIMRTRGPVWTWEDVLTSPKPVAIFLVGGLGFPEVSGTFARVVIGQAIDAIRRDFNRTKTRLMRPFWIFADEADTLGYCSPIIDAVTQLRSVGVNVFSFWQSPSQIDAQYGKKGKPLKDNCDLVITGGLKDPEVLSAFSRLMGDYTAESHSTSEAEHGKSEGRHETARALMKPDEIKALPWGQAIVLADRRNVKLSLPFRIEGDKVSYL